MLENVYSGLGGAIWGPSGLSLVPQHTPHTAVNDDGPVKDTSIAFRVIPKRLRSVPQQAASKPSIPASNVIDFTNALRNANKGAS
jgi:hypothetical protein